MALNSTIIRFKIAVSDVDRNIYQTLELRLAKHPSESTAFLLTRLIAYSLNVQEGIEFTGGIASPDEPAIWVKDLTGQIRLWIDIGNPSARRLHRASKAAQGVKVYTHRDPQILIDEISSTDIHQLEKIELLALSSKFIKGLETTVSRDNVWQLLHTDGEISVTVNQQTAHGEISRIQVGK